MRVVARWEVKGGKDWLELQEENGRYSYDGKGCGGTLPAMIDDNAAILYMEKGKVAVLKSDRPSTKRIVLKGT